jgi:flagellar operon protein
MDDFTRVSSNLQLQLQHQITKSKQTSSSDFADTLQNEIEKSSSVKFSKHALERIASRGVEMSSTVVDSLNQAVTKAREKGCKDIAVIGEKNAFIVSVQNNTVITTMNALEMRENIFTNIDSAVLL